MSISDELLGDWDAMCAALGVMLPINEIGMGTLGYIVPTGEPPIQLEDEAVRHIVMGYNFEDYRYEFPN